MSSLTVLEEKIRSMIDKEIENSFGLELEREDPLGYSLYLFFLTRNKIESRAVDTLIDWMNSWIDIILNQRKLSRFIDREVTSALLGYYSLKSIGRLTIEVDIDKLVAFLSEFITNESFFNNFIYSVLILFSIIDLDQGKIYQIFNKVFAWIRRNIQKEAFYNDGKNLVFTSLLLKKINANNDLNRLVKICLEKTSKNQVRFDDKVYYAWVLWNNKELMDERDIPTIMNFTKETLENATGIFGMQELDESVMEMYGYDIEPEKFSKILLNITLDLLKSFNTSRLMICVPNYVEQKLISLEWNEAWRELDKALVAFENGRLSDCCNNLREALVTIWVKVCEKLQGKTMAMQSGKTTDIGHLKKCLRDHGLLDDTIGIIGQVWSYLSERAHIEKREGKAPTESEVRLSIQLTFAVVENLLRLIS